MRAGVLQVVFSGSLGREMEMLDLRPRRDLPVLVFPSVSAGRFYEFEENGHDSVRWLMSNVSMAG